MQIRYNMVCCYIVRPDGGGGHEFLQLRRRADDFMGGTWQTVYGQSEADETAVAAALRELREETGLVPREFYRLEHVSIFYIVPEDTLWHCVQFCAIVGGEDRVMLNAEHTEFRWLRVAEASGQFMWEDDRKAVAQIVRDILGDGLAKPHVRIMLPPRTGL
jgi:dihydroneopterin triphosphate diphosphatase